VARAAHHQSAFIGGEWSPLAQGRSDLPAYKQALNVCLNGMPIEEGAWTRRSGFQFIAPTRNRLVAKLLPYFFPTVNFALEFTDLCLRIFAGTSPLFTVNHPTVSASSFASNFLTLTVGSVTGLVIGDDCMLWAPSTLDYAAIGPFRNRVMQITAISGTDVTLGDETGAAFSGVSSSSNALATCVLYQIVRIDTPWTGATVLKNLRGIQANTIGEANSILLSSSAAPQELQIDADITFAPVFFEDGPYLDPQPDTGTVSAYTGSITFTPASSTFSATDVGRVIRLYSEPAAWASGTTYAYGATVKYQSQFWQSIAAGSYAAINVGVPPGTMATSGSTQVMVWAPQPQAASWAWGHITAQAGTSCTVNLDPALTLPLESTNGTTITSWRLGLYRSGFYPTCGAYHKGRLWLGGAIENRFDASSANDPTNFSPSDAFGLVTDADAISETLNSDDQNPILWMKSDHQGLLMGTTSGEWLVSASTLNDPFTPTSISADKVTKYGCAFVEPVRVGMALAFVQRYGQRLIEYLADAFSGRFTGRHINEYAKHITAAGIAELAYQEEKVPTVWARMTDGALAGCTYRRVSRFVTEAPVFQGWHRQVIGGSYDAAMVRPVSSMIVLPNDDGLSDLLFVATSDTALANGAIEVLRPLYEDA
jgi:hypothetical protein